MKKCISLLTAALMVLAVSFTSLAASSITSVSASINEAKEEAGTVWYAEPSVSGSGLAIEDYSWSTGYDSWTPGQTVSISITITSSDKSFDKNVTGHLSKGKLVSIKRSDAHTVLIKGNYTPKITLSAPSGICYDEDFTLTWDRVKYAGGYKIEIKKDGSSYKTVSVEKKTEEADLSQYITDEDSIYSIRIKAVAPKGKTDCIKDSDWADLDGNVTSEGESTISGRFSGSGTNMTFKDSDGNTVSGWQLINGSWYYFDPLKSNHAAVDKWLLVGAHYYHFSPEGRMQTGWLKDADRWYFLNDGFMAKDLPEGAMIAGRWIQESFGPGSPAKLYFLYPDGHMAANETTPDGHIVDASGVLIQ